MTDDQIKGEYDQLKCIYNKLGELVKTDSGWEIQGKVDIEDSSGILWRVFDVKIKISNKYPKEIPSIFETGQQIPCNDKTWHINPDGSCCVGPPTRIYRKVENVFTLIRWMDLVVIPYFLDQIHRIERGYYKGTEYAHGSKGLLEDYRKWWNLKSDNEVIERLNWIIGGKSYPRNQLCFCGSDKKFKRCHFGKDHFDGIPITVYKDDLRMIKNELKNG